MCSIRGSRFGLETRGQLFRGENGNSTNLAAEDDFVLDLTTKKWTEQVAARNMLIAHEGIQQAAHDRIVAPMRDAHYIYFIGFGYDEGNLTKRGAPDVFGPAVVRGTAYELTLRRPRV